MKNHLTRKILLSIVFCFALMSVRAQYVTIPDTNFVNWLNTHGYSGCMNGNQMDTTCNAVVNASSVDCSNSNIYDITGINYFDILDTLACYFNSLSTLPPLPSTLKSLYCHDNQLSLLPSLPASLNILFCEANNLNTLPPLPSSLKFLGCGLNQLTSLPPLPLSLIHLSCYLNFLDSLPALPSVLSALDCDGNQLTVLPPLSASLTYLECDNNQLSSLPLLPSTMTELFCRNNLLTSLLNLPSSLTIFDCSYNQLTSLPNIPSSLPSLRCHHNHLTSLPSLPTSLIDLDCNNNQLTFLPPLHAFFHIIKCSNNQLTSLPTLPDSLINFEISNNPNLSCLPSINKISHFEWYNTNITCLPNIINITNSVAPPITFLPICDLINVNNCSIYWNIRGTIFTDIDSNCIVNSIELLNNNVKLILHKNGNFSQQTFTNGLGQYSFEADTSTYTYSVDTIGLPFIVNCPASLFYTSIITTTNQFHYDKDFSIECKPGFDVGVNGVVNTSGRFRPATYATINVLAGDISNHYNLHCATGITGTVTVVINGPTSFSSVSAGALTPIVDGDTLVYSISDFGTVNFQNDFSFIVQTDTTAQAGDQVCFDVTVTPLAGDNNTANNFYTHCFMVTNSFDPNEKEVSPSGSIDTSQHLLTYTIYFQNTGTDTALFVYVLDTLDNAIDESSIQLLAYSHEPLVQVTGKIVKFNFPNINLPDSTTDEPNSHGYVQYKLRIKNTAPVGTIIHNTGYNLF